MNVHRIWCFQCDVRAVKTNPPQSNLRTGRRYPHVGECTPAACAICIMCNATEPLRERYRVVDSLWNVMEAYGVLQSVLERYGTLRGVMEALLKLYGA